MSKFKKTLKKIEDAMLAATFAEEGEFETAREMLREERRVLLAVREGQLDNNTFRYAVNTCKRIRAHLDILYVSASTSLHPLFEQSLTELNKEGIDFRLIKKNGCLKQQIIDYTNSEKEIIFAVTNSSDNLNVECKGKGRRLSEAWRQLKCPLVVVGDNI